MKTFEIKTVQVVPQEQIDDVLTDALEHGISYWCDGVEIKKKPEEECKYASDVLTRGGTLRLHDRMDGKWLFLELEPFLTALGDMQFNFGDYDSLDADAAVQRALFGEVIYG